MLCFGKLWKQDRCALPEVIKISKAEVLNEEELTDVVGGTHGHNGKVAKCGGYILRGAGTGALTGTAAGGAVGAFGGAMFGGSIGIIKGSASCVGYLATHR